jgi:hypothetical protein
VYSESKDHGKPNFTSIIVEKAAEEKGMRSVKVYDETSRYIRLLSLLEVRAARLG